MKNMKKVLSALTALSLVAVAGVSAVACDGGRPPEPKNPNKAIGPQASEKLGFYYSEGSGTYGSNIKIKIDDPTKNNESMPRWVVDYENIDEFDENIDASMLLEKNGASSSIEAYNFLTDALHLSGTFNSDEGVYFFKIDEAKKIKFRFESNTVKIINWEPVSNKTGSDFWIKYAEIEGQWYIPQYDANNTFIGEEKICKTGWKVDAPNQSDESAIFKMLNPYWIENEAFLTDFEAKYGGVIQDFAIGNETEKVNKMGEIIYLKENYDTPSSQWLNNLASSLGVALTLRIEKLERAEGHENDSELVAGDKLYFTVSMHNGFGTVDFKDKFYFLLKGDN